MSGLTHTVADEADYCRHMAAQQPSWEMGDDDSWHEYFGVDHSRLTLDQREAVVAAGVAEVDDGDTEAAEWLMSTPWARALLSRAEREACERLLGGER